MNRSMAHTGRSTCRRCARPSSTRSCATRPGCFPPASRPIPSPPILGGARRRNRAGDAGALPLLSYLLDDMWSEMVERGDGVLRLPVPAIDLGRVLVERANKFVAEHPGAEDTLRRILTLKLATVREDGEPTRRRAARSGYTDEEGRRVSGLPAHPNRLRVTATPEAGAAARVPQTANPRAGVAAGSGETYAEVAHEAIFRRWDKLREWIAAEREFLAWRSGLETARRT